MPNSIIVGDWNNDYQLDIAVTDCNTNNIGVFLRHGDGMFASRRFYSTGSDTCPNSLASGDFNNDSLADIIVTHSNNSTVGVFLGITYMNGLRENTYPTGSSPHPRAVAIGDFNKDTLLDIAIANYALGNIGAVFGYSNGTFSKQNSFTTGSLSFPTSIAIGDLDNNSELDIAVANSGAQNVGILYGYGNDSFMNLVTYPTGIGSIPQSVAIGDFNNDKKWDIAVASDGTNKVNILLKYDIGAFGSQISYSTGTGSNPIGVAVGDFNSDGWLDFAVTNKGGNSIGIFLASGNGTFSGQAIYYSTGSGSSPWGIAVGDFNNDSRPDIVVANFGTFNIGVFLGLNNGTFMSQITYSTGSNSYPMSIAVGDFNNDSRLDIVTANYYGEGVCVLLGCGNGTFMSQTTYSTGSNSLPSSVAIGDFNNDSRLDIAVANSGAVNIGIFFGQGDGTFFNQMTYATGKNSSPCSVAVADFNNDSRLDIAVTNYVTNSIGILFGYGNGSFSSLTIYPTGNDSGPVGLTIGDFNNDNQVDIAVSNSGTYSLGIFLACTDGTFFDQLTYSTGDYSQFTGTCCG